MNISDTIITWNLNPTSFSSFPSDINNEFKGIFMDSVVASFSRSLPRIVNPDLINCRKNENMVDYITDICTEIVKMVGGGYVKYEGFETDDSGKQIREINRSKSKKKKKNQNESVISVDDTYCRPYIFKFKLSFQDEVRQIRMPIYLPIVSSDGFNYTLRGNQYCAPFQIIDSVTYNRQEPNRDEVCLKTLVRVLKLGREKLSITDVTGKTYHTYKFTMTMNKKVKDVPFLLFYFATFGFFTTAKFFGMRAPAIDFGLYAEADPNDEIRIYFPFGDVYIGVRRKIFEADHGVREYVATTIACKKKSTYQDTINKVQYWRTQLGMYVSKANAIAGGDGIVETFRDSLDSQTIKVIKEFIGGEKKETIYSVVRWMFLKYSSLVSKDASMANKRLRLSEYIVTPITKQMVNRVYRFKKAKGKMRDIKKLEDIFKISPSILIDAIIGKSNALNIAKYSSTVNTNALFNSILKMDKGGPGTSMENSNKYAPLSFQKLDVSQVGKIDIISASNGMPGIAGYIVPSAKIDLKKMYLY